MEAAARLLNAPSQKLRFLPRRSAVPPVARRPSPTRPLFPGRPNENVPLHGAIFLISGRELSFRFMLWVNGTGGSKTQYYVTAGLIFSPIWCFGANNGRGFFLATFSKLLSIKIASIIMGRSSATCEVETFRLLKPFYGKL